MIADLREKGLLNDISVDRYEKYFGWIVEYETLIDDFEFRVGVVDLIKETVRKFGLSHETYEYLKMYFDLSDACDNEKQKLFVDKALNAVEEESKKLDKDQVLICSTEVLESVFGKFKAIINKGHQGITSNILGMSAIVGSKPSALEVKETMENCNAKLAFSWVKEKVGMTLGSIRYKYFRGIKGTKFDNKAKGVICA